MRPGDRLHDVWPAVRAEDVARGAVGANLTPGTSSTRSAGHALPPALAPPQRVHRHHRPRRRAGARVDRAAVRRTASAHTPVSAYAGRPRLTVPKTHFLGAHTCLCENRPAGPGSGTRWPRQPTLSPPASGSCSQRCSPSTTARPAVLTCLDDRGDHMARRQFGAVRRLPSGRWQARFQSPGGEMLSAPSTFTTKLRPKPAATSPKSSCRWHAAAGRRRLPDVCGCTTTPGRGWRDVGSAVARSRLARSAATGTALPSGSCRRWGS